MSLLPPFNEIELAAFVDETERMMVTEPVVRFRRRPVTYPHYRLTPITARIVNAELARRGVDCICRPYPDPTEVEA